MVTLNVALMASPLSVLAKRPHMIFPFWPALYLTGWQITDDYAMLATNEKGYKGKLMLHPTDCMPEIESLTVAAGNAIMKVREKGVARTDKADGSRHRG